jgi:hypothetical protein
MSKARGKRARGYSARTWATYGGLNPQLLPPLVSRVQWDRVPFTLTRDVDGVLVNNRVFGFAQLKQQFEGMSVNSLRSYLNKTSSVVRFGNAVIYGQYGFLGLARQHFSPNTSRYRIRATNEHEVVRIFEDAQLAGKHFGVSANTVLRRGRDLGALPDADGEYWTFEIQAPLKDYDAFYRLRDYALALLLLRKWYLNLCPDDEMTLDMNESIFSNSTIFRQFSNEFYCSIVEAVRAVRQLSPLVVDFNRSYLHTIMQSVADGVDLAVNPVDAESLARTVVLNAVKSGIFAQS